MKYSTLLFCIFCSFGSMYAQMSFTYSPDNSELSILFEKSIVLDSARTQVELDLKNRWQYKKCKKVKIAIRGACLLETSTDTLSQTTLNIDMFGKSFTRKIYSNQDYIEEFTRPGRFLYKRPRIIISLLGHNSDRKVYIDAFDLSANQYPSKPKK